MLGTACNWKCKYCLQIKQAGFNQKLNNSFCQELEEFISSNSLSIDRIEYWGGEPCLYFDQIKKIDQQIRPYTKRPSRFVTNGSLLNKDIVDFLNQQDMYVNLSYHEGQLNDIGWKQAMFIKNLHVTSLIHSKCLTWEPYYNKWLYLLNKFGRYLNWYIFNLYNVDCVSSYCLSKNNIDFYIAYLQSILYLSKTNIFYKNALQALLSTELQKQTNHQCACFNDDVLSIDTLGNQYICHHACSKDFKIGNIFKDGINKTKINTLKNKCKSCKLLSYCNGGCMREINDTSCYFLHKLFEFKQKNQEFLNEI